MIFQELRVTIGSFGIPVGDCYFGVKNCLISRADSAAEIDIFHIHEISFVKEANFAKNCRPDKHKAA